MKAIIMAGGEGTRLRPVSLHMPKPMVSLFDRPVLAHTLNLLKRHEIFDACLTLRFLPQVITDYFGDGGAWGMRLTHHIEEEPLGTAGGVAACGDFIDGEHVLILSGDAVCDFDLGRCIQFHFDKDADATIVLYAHPEPLEYGLVMTGTNQRVERFIEKPPWNQVFTNQINTGIYILSPAALAEIPTTGSYDFGRDLFPKLLERGMKLYGVEAEGYWCDIGSPGAYLQCAVDALEEKLTLDFGVERRGQSLWAHSPVGPGVTVVGPCYIGKNVVLESGVTLGPYAVIGENSHIAAGAGIVRSVIDGASVGAESRLDGTILGRGASVRPGAILYEGSVIGGGTIVGAGAVVEANVRVWPGKEIPPASRVRENLVTGQPRSGLRFSGGGVIRGEAGVDLTPEACLAIGSALGGVGRVGIAYSGEAAAGLAARAIVCGVSAVGGMALELDCPFESAAGYAADLYGLERTVFVRQRGGEIHLKIYGPRGMPITREEERQVESTLSAGDLQRATAFRTGEMDTISGVIEAYVSAAADWGDLGDTPPTLAVEVRGGGASNRALRRALEQMGVTMATHGWGVPVFETARGGMILRAEDEEGYSLEPERLLAILVMLELEAGAQCVAVPYAAPVALDILAASFNAQILRLGRDPVAMGLYYRQPYLRDGVFAACRLAGAMTALGQSLHEIAARAPQFYSARKEVTVAGDRAAIMGALAAGCESGEAELVEGIRVPTAGGWVHISPSAGRPVLKIRGEGRDMEAAEEICVDFAQRLATLDGK